MQCNVLETVVCSWIVNPTNLDKTLIIIIIIIITRGQWKKTRTVDKKSHRERKRKNTAIHVWRTMEIVYTHTHTTGDQTNIKVEPDYLTSYIREARRSERKRAQESFVWRHIGGHIINTCQYVQLSIHWSGCWWSGCWW